MMPRGQAPALALALGVMLSVAPPCVRLRLRTKQLLLLECCLCPALSHAVLQLSETVLWALESELP